MGYTAYLEAKVLRNNYCIQYLDSFLKKKKTKTKHSYGRRQNRTQPTKFRYKIYPSLKWDGTRKQKASIRTNRRAKGKTECISTKQKIRLQNLLPLKIAFKMLLKITSGGSFKHKSRTQVTFHLELRQKLH